MKENELSTKLLIGKYFCVIIMCKIVAEWLALGPSTSKV